MAPDLTHVRGSSPQDAVVELVDSDGVRIGSATTDLLGIARFPNITSNQSVELRVVRTGYVTATRSI